MAFYIDFKILKYSIVNTIEDVENKKDEAEPYSFIDFVKNLDVTNLNNEFIVDSYNKYLIEWTKIKNQSVETFEDIRKQKYTSLLKNIQLNFLNQDEQRILGNINFDDPLELDVAIPFFVEKIKDIIQYYINKRRDVKNSKARWSTKGSKEFLENTISEYIIDNYTKNENTFQQYKQSYQELSSFQNQYRLEYNGLYDLNDYRDIEITVNDSEFLSSASNYELSSLPLSAFSDYNPSDETLISELKKQIYKKYISTDKQYINNGVVTDINSTTPFYDPYNYNQPLVSRISDTSNLLRDSDIGYYFTSKYIYTSNYFSPYGITVSDISTLDGLYPKLDVYRSEDYKDYYLWGKYGTASQALIGKPITNERLKRFYGYQSRDLNIADSVGGVEKYTDDIQLWGGSGNNTWLNSDIFDKFENNILNRDKKNDFYFNLNENESIFKYITDIFGNQYYLVKQINVQKPSSENIYTLNTSIISDTLDIANFSLIGQRFNEASSLMAIEIENNISLGFYIDTTTLSATSITALSDFNIDDLSYYTLDATKFDTVSLSSEPFDNQKSLYENKYSVGTLYIRDINNKNINTIDFFINDVFNDTTYFELINELIDVDIVNDFAIFTTTNKMVFAKISYDFATSELSFNEINKNTEPFYNSPLHKTASYWYNTRDANVYFCNVNHNSFEFSYYYINIESNTKVTLNVDDSDIDYEIDNLIDIDNISKPQLIKKDNNLYTILLLKDVCDNYYYQIIKYRFVTKNEIKAVYNRVYHPSSLKITSDIVSDATALSSTELSSYSLSSFSNSRAYYWDNNSNISEVYNLTYSPYESKTHYDNDSGGIISRNKPSTYYLLSDLVSTITPDINTSTSQDLYLFAGDFVYTPVEILLDFRNILNFDTYISRTEPIYKIEYVLNDIIKTQYILQNSQIDFDNEYASTGTSPLSALAQELPTQPLSAVAENIDFDSVIALTKGNDLSNQGLYNNQFQTSPINMKYISFINELTNFSIIFYSLSGKSYTLEFNFNGLDFALSEKYNKVELLDARIRETTSDRQDCLIYLNTRKPDSIINTTLLNI